MSAILIAGLMLAQASTITVEANREQFDVGYRELVAGRPTEAIERIAANRALDADDPVALINRGTAEARLGLISDARDSFRTALASRQRYDLELRDGTWMDSRGAARLAIKLLETGHALALK